MEIKEKEVFIERKDDKQRDKKIIKTSIIGIITNVFLALFKAIVGLMSNSIAIVLDAVNNLSDASSSTITIIGTKLSAKEPNRKHPFGYGRIEYLTSMFIAMIVLYAGIASLVESIKKIVAGEVPNYSTLSIVIISIAVVVKIVLGLYVRAVGKKIESSALKNSGVDALNDSIISFATLVSIFIFKIFNLSLEAYLGAIISLFIIKTGIQMIIEATSKVVGERVDLEKTNEITAIINSHEAVKGSYDLIVNDYGQNKYTASVHIEVDEELTARDIDELSRHIAMEVYTKTGIIMTAIGIYSINSKDENATKIKENIEKISFSHKNVLQLHGFYLDEDAKKIQFDLVISFDEKDRGTLIKEIQKEVEEAYPGYSILILLDKDYNLS